MARSHNRAVVKPLDRDGAPALQNRCVGCGGEFGFTSLRLFLECVVCAQCAVTLNELHRATLLERQVRYETMADFAKAFELSVGAVREIGRLLLIPQADDWERDKQIDLVQRLRLYEGMKMWTNYSVSSRIAIHRGFAASSAELEKLATRCRRMRALARRESPPRDDHERRFVTAFERFGKPCDDAVLWRSYVSWCVRESCRLNNEHKTLEAQRIESFARERRLRSETAANNIEDPARHADWRELDRRKNEHS
ncbi:MAG: hypothetical protein ACK5Q4_14815 [Phycisphaerae bacterium]|jgi:hypothetical protein